MDSHLVVCLWGHCSSLYHREALAAAAVCNCSLQSSVQPWQGGLTSHSLFAAVSIARAAQGSLRTLKCGRSRTEGQQEEVLGGAAPEGTVSFHAP